MTNKDKTVTDALEYLKKNLNNYNNLSAVKSKSFEEKKSSHPALQKNSHSFAMTIFFGALSWIRTSGLSLRRGALYPTEL